MQDSNKPIFYKIAIMILPIGVVLGTAAFMWMYYAKHKEKQDEQSVISAPGIRIGDLEDMVGKFTELIGSRHIDTEQGRVGLRRAAVMIESRLGSQNMGFQVRKCSGEAAHGRLWKSIWVDVRGEESPEEVVMAVTSYHGDGKDADSNAVAAMMMVASSVAREKPARTIRFVFLPFDREPAAQEKWLRERCLTPDETLAGVVAVKSMKLSAGELPASGWTVVGPAGELAQWQTILNGKRSEGGASHWLSHHVFYTGNYVDATRQRLEATLPVAQQLKKALLVQAGE